MTTPNRRGDLTDGISARIGVSGLTANTSAKPLVLAHQAGALPEADTYLGLLEFNLGRIGAAIGP